MIYKDKIIDFFLFLKLKNPKIYSYLVDISFIIIYLQLRTFSI
jgi:hypothetical protein